MAHTERTDRHLCLSRARACRRASRWAGQLPFTFVQWAVLTGFRPQNSFPPFFPHSENDQSPHPTPHTHTLGSAPLGKPLSQVCLLLGSDAGRGSWWTPPLPRFPIPSPCRPPLSQPGHHCLLTWPRIPAGTRQQFLSTEEQKSGRRGREADLARRSLPKWATLNKFQDSRSPAAAARPSHMPAPDRKACASLRRTGLQRRRCPAWPEPSFPRGRQCLARKKARGKNIQGRLSFFFFFLFTPCNFPQMAEIGDDLYKILPQLAAAARSAGSGYGKSTGKTLPAGPAAGPLYLSVRVPVLSASRGIFLAQAQAHTVSRSVLLS